VTIIFVYEKVRKNKRRKTLGSRSHNILKQQWRCWNEAFFVNLGTYISFFYYSLDLVKWTKFWQVSKSLEIVLFDLKSAQMTSTYPIRRFSFCMLTSKLIFKPPISKWKCSILLLFGVFHQKCVILNNNTKKSTRNEKNSKAFRETDSRALSSLKLNNFLLGKSNQRPIWRSP